MFLQKKALGSDLYDQVIYSLDIIEREYFGLQFTDANSVKHWLDPTKTIKKQVKSMAWNSFISFLYFFRYRSSINNCFVSCNIFSVGLAYTFRLKVKFYSSEPNALREELTRYQFFLQLKQDLFEGRLECPEQKCIELCALAIQCEWILKQF